MSGTEEPFRYRPGMTLDLFLIATDTLALGLVNGAPRCVIREPTDPTWEQVEAAS